MELDFLEKKNMLVLRTAHFQPSELSLLKDSGFKRHLFKM